MLAKYSESEGSTAIVGVSEDVLLDGAKSSIRKAGSPYANFVDPSQAYFRKIKGSAPLAIPSSFLVQGGRVVAVHIGPFKSAQEIDSYPLVEG